jgi:competence ComEA-like helix-hairpin-helix protein
MAVQPAPAAAPQPVAAPIQAPPPTVANPAATVPLPRSAQIALVALLLLAAFQLAYHAMNASPGRARPTELVPYRVDLNHAGKEELKQIPGIGDATADRIIAYRSRQHFRSVDDLVHVDGIGRLTLEKLRRFLCVVDEENDGDDGPAPSSPTSFATSAASVPPSAKKTTAASAVAAKSSAKTTRTSTKKKTTTQLIDINKAGMDELQSLTGIGPTRAAEIIREREKQPFKSVDDLTRVSGIKLGILDKIRERLTVGETQPGLVKAD